MFRVFQSRVFSPPYLVVQNVDDMFSRLVTKPDRDGGAESYNSIYRAMHIRAHRANKNVRTAESESSCLQFTVKICTTSLRLTNCLVWPQSRGRIDNVGVRVYMPNHALNFSLKKSSALNTYGTLV